jgi:hypothetical protein
MKVETRIKRYDSQKAERSTWDTRWQKLKEWYAPHQAHVTEKSYPEDNAYRSNLHDTKSIEASDILTQGHISFIMPLNERWFSYTPNVKQDEGDEVKAWFSECSKIAYLELQASNFYPTAYSACKDRTECGTGCMFVRKGRKHKLSYEYVEIGTYVFSEDEDGNADELTRSIMLSAPDAVKRWGKEKMGPKVLDAYDAFNSGKGEGKKFEFLHIVEPRIERDENKMDSKNLPYASFYIGVEDKIEIEESGFEEFPYLVTRFQRWGSAIWGFTPAYNALPNVLSVNWLKKLVKLIGEVAANPRLLALAGEKTNIDLTPGGTTYVSRQAVQAGLPKEWGTAGDFQAAQYLIEQDHEQIERFFHTNLFRMFADLDRDMTATEISAREREKLLLFAPTFVQFAFDQAPMMTRMFNILARDGAFPEPPESMVDEEGNAYVETPNVSYQSKVALALNGLNNESFDRVMPKAMALAEIVPSVIDNFDTDEIIRTLARNQGMPEKWLTKMDEMLKSREEQMAAQQQQMQMEQMEQAAGALGKAGGAQGVEQIAGMVEE